MPYLTEAERKVLRMMAEGFTVDQTAEMLFLTSNTVKTHLKRISGRLQARNTTHAVVLALTAGDLDQQEPAPALRPPPLPKPRSTTDPGRAPPATPYDRNALATKYPSINWGVEEWFEVLKVDDDLYFRILKGMAKVSSRHPRRAA